MKWLCLYNLLFYTTDRGDSPIDDFLDSLDKKARAKVAAHLPFSLPAMKYGLKQ